MKKTRIILLVPVALYFALTSIYLLAVPPGESPDEPSHLQCIEQVALYGRIPIIEPKPRGEYWWSRDRIISGLVCAHMPLYYFVSGFADLAVSSAAGIPVHYEFPPNDPLWATGASLAMFTHPQRTAPLQLSEPANVTALRLMSMLLGFATVVSSYIVARRFSENQYVPALAMTITAGWPQFLFMSRAITNDTLATALAAWTGALLISGRSPRKYVVTSILAAAAVLSKLTMAFCIVAVVVSWLIEVYRTPNKADYLRNAAVGLCIFALLAGLLLLHPVLRDHLRWSQRTLTNRNPAIGTLRYWIDVADTTLQSGWARFGWMNVLTPRAPAYLWWLALVSSAAAGLFAVTKRRHAFGRAGLLSVIWLLGVAGIYLRINLDRFQPQFRYAFAAVPVIAGLAAAGTDTWFGGDERRTKTAILLVGGLLAGANLWLLLGYLIPAYG